MRGGGVTYGAAVSEKPGAITPSVNLHIVTNKKNNNLKIFFSIKWKTKKYRDFEKKTCRENFDENLPRWKIEREKCGHFCR